jgi:hypothetical protein
MARPLRLEFAGALYHVTAREDRQEDIQYKIGRDKDLSEIPKSQRRPKAKSLDYYARRASNRNEAILASY